MFEIVRKLGIAEHENDKSSKMTAKNAKVVAITCFIFTILGAKAFEKLKLFELAIMWCYQGLAVSFYTLYSSIADK